MQEQATSSLAASSLPSSSERSSSSAPHLEIKEGKQKLSIVLFSYLLPTSDLIDFHSHALDI